MTQRRKAHLKGKRITGKTKCFIHSDTSALTHCSVCGRPICQDCAAHTGYPHVCSFCHPKNEMKRSKSHRSMFIKVSAVVILVAMLSWTALWLLSPIDDIRDDFRELDRPDPNAPNPEAKLFLENGLIYPKLNEKQYAGTNDYVTINFKIYLTNNYDDPIAGVQVDLLILTKEVIWGHASKKISSIGAGTTEVIEFSNVAMPMGEHDAEFVLWQRTKVTQKTRMDFIVNQGDVSIPPPPSTDGGRDSWWGDGNATGGGGGGGAGGSGWGYPGSDGGDGSSGASLMEADDNSVAGFGFTCCIFLAIVLLVVVVIAVIVIAYKRSSDDPSDDDTLTLAQVPVARKRTQAEMLRSLELDPECKR